MHETASFLIAGGIFVVMGIASSMFERLPCSTAMFYLAAGFVLGPAGVGLLALSLPHDAALLRILTQIALLVSLFAIGLRLRVPVLDAMWSLPLRLGFLAMIVTVPLLTLAGVGILKLGWDRRCCLPPFWRRPIQCWRMMCKSAIPAISTGCASRSPAKAV